MRLAVVTQSRDRVGGVETYLEAVLPALSARYQVAFFSASQEVTERGAVRLPPAVEPFPLDGAADRLRQWRPDLLFAHGIDDDALEARAFDIAPAVVVQHTYHGTCISSAKTMRWPVIAQCDRTLGPVCLAMYFPRRCGGLNPVTMARLYRTQVSRLRNMAGAAAVVTLSDHMAEEMRKHGVPRERVHVVPPFVNGAQRSNGSTGPRMARDASTSHILYLGRLEPLKGVARLLAALRPAADRLRRPVRLVVAGDGAERAGLEASAAAIREADRRISIDFVGWQNEAGRARLFADSDLLVVPSIWPEPFGLVGLEAAVAGVPAVAFAVGGIPEWLREGENGCLAPAEGARPELLADAMTRALSTPERQASLAAGARTAAERWTLARHLEQLQGVLDTVVGPARVVQAS